MTFSKFSVFVFVVISCSNVQKQDLSSTKLKNLPSKVSDIPLPKGYKRIDTSENSFAQWLRKIEIKKDRTVYLYNGDRKTNQEAQFAVLNIPVGDKDLQQCADAVIRLRAMYLFEQKRFNEISFTDNENNTYTFKPPFTIENFEKYLQKVFAMCGSASLSKQLHAVNDFENIEPGDVIIKGGFPGHAVIVLDVAINNGKKLYLLAQSYMPAQDIHILLNPNDSILSPWYQISNNPTINTPEYVFSIHNLRRW